MPIDIAPIIAYAKTYNDTRINLNIEIVSLNVRGYYSIYKEIRKNVFQWILTGAEKIVDTSGPQDITMFMFDQNEWLTSPGSPYPLREDTPSSDTILVNGKPFINLGVYSPLLNNAEITFCHELMHAYKYLAIAEGYPVDDCMDVMFVNGIPENYYLNDQPDNVNSNFINMWERLYPWFSNQPK